MKKSLYTVPYKKQIRLFIDTDANCEADDDYAIIHALMTPKAEVKGIIAGHYGGKTSGEMEKSYQEIIRICMLGGYDPCLALKGAKGPMKNEREILESEGVFALIAEAMSEDKRPLFVICQGALSNIASAILKQPEICGKMILIIVGGIHYPAGGYEFNTMNDRHAFNMVMKSAVPCWVLPEEVYATMQAGMTELFYRLFDCGDLGRYLVERTRKTADTMLHVVPDTSMEAPYDYAVGFPNGESWSLGDSCGIGVLISHNCGRFREVRAPYVNPDGSYLVSEQAKKVRWYSDVNSRFILEDFFYKMKYYFERR